MWCPTYRQGGVNPLLGVDNYSTPNFMSTDSGGIVRDTYQFNPRQENAPAGQYTRRYQKASNVHHQDIFMVDYMENPTGNTTPGVPFTQKYWSHWPSKGLNVGFTDGSAKFVAMLGNLPGSTVSCFDAISQKLITDESSLSLLQYNSIFNYVQQHYGR